MENRLVQFLVFVVCLFIVSCSQPCGSAGGDTDGLMCEEYIRSTWTISSQFSNNEIEEIVKASDEWSDSTSGKVNISWIVTDSDPDLRKVVIMDDRPENVYATNRFGKKIDIRSDISLLSLRAFAAHELGHKFGLGHKSSGLMYRIVKHDSHITDDDLVIFNGLWNDRN